MIKTAVGFIFTEQPVHQLTELGFSLRRNDDTLKFGYREFLCLFAEANMGFELREVLDEDLYFKFDPRGKFAPFEYEKAAVPGPTVHANTVYELHQVLDERMENGDLKKIIKIRKSHPLWALWLRCEKFDYFMKDTAGLRQVEWRGREAVLITLGQSCFDLVITR